MLREILGPERDEVTGEWRRLLNEELSDLYCSPHIVRVVKSRMRWTGHVASIGNRRGACRGDLRERVHLEDLSVDGRIAFRQDY